MGKLSLDTLVKDIYFGEPDVRIMNCLKRYDVETLRQLVAISRTGILDMRNMGAISRTTIENWLDARGLRLGMTKEEIAEYEGATAETEEGKEEAAVATEVEHPMIKTEETPPPTEDEVLEKAVEEVFQNQGINLEHEVFLLAKEIFLYDMMNCSFPSHSDARYAASVAVKLYTEVKEKLKKLKEQSQI